MVQEKPYKLNINFMSAQMDAQRAQFSKHLSELFFNLSIDAPLETLVTSSDLELEHSTSIDNSSDDIYMAMFTEHTQIEKEILAGQFTIRIDEEDRANNCYLAFLDIEFDSIDDMADEVEHLKKKFKHYPEKPVVFSDTSVADNANTITYFGHKDTKLPSITFSYDLTQTDDPVLYIMLVNCVAANTCTSQK